MRSRKQNLNAFTLVELLVVVVIIGVLAGLAASGLSSGKNAAYLADCKGNLRQIGLALQLYLTDTSRFPLSQEYGRHWAQRFEPYTREAWPETDFQMDEQRRSERGIYQCRGYATINGKFANISDGVGTYLGGAYGYNVSGLHPIESTGLGGGGRVWNEGGVREAEVVNPASMIAFGDAVFTLGSYPSGRDYGLGIEDLGVGMYRPDFLRDSNASITRRHSGQWSSCYVDGHVESESTASFFGRETTEKLKRWNKDNLPHAELLVPVSR